MRHTALIVASGVAALAPLPAAAQSTGMLDDLKWIGVGRLVPGSIGTVLPPAGTLEPHGMLNNGANNTVPFELAKRLARRGVVDRLTALVTEVIEKWDTTLATRRSPCPGCPAPVRCPQ